MNNLNTKIHRGRDFLYELYAAPESKERVADAADIFLSNLDSFQDIWSLIETGTAAKYDFSEHDFVVQKSDLDINDLDREKCSRDYLVNQIKKIVEELFPNSRDDNKTCVEQFLMHKLLKHGHYQNEKEFIEGGKIVPAERSIRKLMNKLVIEKFLSQKEKEGKKWINSSLYHKIIHLQDEIEELKNKIVDIFDRLDNIPSSADNILKLVQSATEKIIYHEVFSDDAKKMKETLLSELKALLNRRDAQKLQSFKILFSESVVNFLPDEVCRELKEIRGYVESNAMSPQVKQLQEALREKEAKLREYTKPPTDHSPLERVFVKPSILVKIAIAIRDFFIEIGRWFLKLWKAFFGLS